MEQAYSSQQAEATTATKKQPPRHDASRPASPALARNPLWAQLTYGNQLPPSLRLSPEPVQRKQNTTGLPDTLKTGIENLSGLSMDDVHVHYQSSKPAQVQALAYTQGTDIHVAPGQEQHLAHEAWHVVQQKQGRVRATMQAKGVAINDDEGLEREADVMEERMVHQPVQKGEGLRHISPYSVVFQRVSAAPTSVTVHVVRGSTRVVKVTDKNDQEIGFVSNGYEGEVPEGSVFLAFSQAGKLLSVRFAAENTPTNQLSDMKKITTFTLVEVEGGKETEVEAEVEEGEQKTTFKTFNIKTKPEEERIIEGGFTAFEITSKGNQGDIHFRKHGAEFGATTQKPKYIKMAQDFGKDEGKEFLEAKINNTLIKVDPLSRQPCRVLIANNKLLRSFYIWNHDFTNPFAYAIYYTITNSLGLPLAHIDQSYLSDLEQRGINLFDMEREVIASRFRAGQSFDDVKKETKASEEVISSLMLQTLPQDY